MNQEDEKSNRQHSIIDELKSIREALKKAPAFNESLAELPILDEIIHEAIVSEIDEIPILADTVIMSTTETSELAKKSWPFVEKKLYQWSATMDNPVSFLTHQLFQQMSAQLATNWNTIFSNQTQQQLQMWKQLILKNDSDS